MTSRFHAFVAMPFGTKPGPDGQPIDFNRVYDDYIAPALQAAGMEVFRADEEMRAGDIRADMFQELLLADLVVADLTVDNPNVWYELGVRHALRSRGVVLVTGGSGPFAFDLYTDRKLRYSLQDGKPSPSTLEEDRNRLTAMARATMESWHGRKISPVYQLLPNLKEPDWKSLRIGDVLEFWEQHAAWEERIELARREERIGDLLLLADEAPVAAFRAEGWLKAGEALRNAEHFGFALEQLERGLAIEPDNLKFLREKGICLQRLALAGYPGHSLDRVIEYYQNVLEIYPKDPETWALQGRANKDAWIGTWRREGLSPEQMREEAAYEDALLRAAIDCYDKAFRSCPGHYYSGINALTLMHLYRHLTGDRHHDRQMSAMAGAVLFAAQNEQDEGLMFWAKATIGDLQVLAGTPADVKAAYKEAIARNAKDWFALDSCCGQLQLLKSLGFRPDTVEMGIAIFARALAKRRGQDTEQGKDRWQPRRVILFSGHMIDAPNRHPPRFPAEKENAAANRINGVLEGLGAGPDDLALSQAAAGGDILFLEACLRRGMRCQVLLPFSEPEFIQRSILPSQGGPAWRDRFYTLRRHLCEAPNQAPRIMPEALGPSPRGADPFERCNLWLLYTAMSYGIDKLHFLCLWNGMAGDGPGGTGHLWAEIRNRSGWMEWIDIDAL